ncbi:VanZ family protein [Microbacterium hydrocarbonoxydans]|uniref:VanZ family protein n=1 Tax=Microbacterium hydrocarbonoxydans TaxID=273678 RepID=UPI0013DA7D04|nr:VanZ family protein [Microbacterium hydrocarbonoxydans]
MEIPPRPAPPAVPASARVPWWRHMTPWAIVYGLVVAYIVFWPTPSDFGLSPWLRRIAAIVPALTPMRVEFAANILLFVPLGIGLAILLPRHRYLVLPLGFLATLTIESLQGLLLSGRGATVIDLIANTAGACVGLVAVAAFEGLMRHRTGPPLASPPASP